MPRGDIAGVAAFQALQAAGKVILLLKAPGR